MEMSNKKIWITSDTHFGHQRDFLWGSRGFKSSEEHDEAIIRNWNEVVGPEDEVYHLGDVMLNDNEHGMSCINRLNGRIHLVLGNHDTEGRVALYETCPNIVEIVHAIQIKYKKYYFFLCHYPVITANYDDQKVWAKHLICLHGHTHSKEIFSNNNPYMYNICLDAHNNYPIEITQIIEDIKQKKEEIDKDEKN